MATKITEGEIEDIIYCARASELDELRDCLSTTSVKYDGLSTARVVIEAIDADTGNNALHYAAANGHTDIVKYILSLLTSPETVKPFVNAQNQSGNTPLHWAALNGHLDVVKLLLRAGADVSILNKAGYDAVFEAELNDKGAVVDWLLKEGEGVDQGLDGAAQEDEGMAEVEVEDMEAGAEDVVDGVGKMELDEKKDGV